jgi:hypothetical protein
MKRFLVNCRNHRGRTRDVAISAVSEAEAIGYLRRKGFTDCVVRGAAPGKIPDDATEAVPVLPDPDAPAAPAPPVPSFDRPPRPQPAKPNRGATRRSSERATDSGSDPDARDLDQDGEAQDQEQPWWATARGVGRRAWSTTRALAGKAWLATRRGCVIGWTWILARARMALERMRKKKQE